MLFAASHQASMPVCDIFLPPVVPRNSALTALLTAPVGLKEELPPRILSFAGTGVYLPCRFSLRVSTVVIRHSLFHASRPAGSRVLRASFRNALSMRFFNEACLGTRLFAKKTRRSAPEPGERAFRARTARLRLPLYGGVCPVCLPERSCRHLCLFPGKIVPNKIVPNKEGVFSSCLFRTTFRFLPSAAAH